MEKETEEFISGLFSLIILILVIVFVVKTCKCVNKFIDTVDQHGLEKVTERIWKGKGDIK